MIRRLALAALVAALLVAPGMSHPAAYVASNRGTEVPRYVHSLEYVARDLPGLSDSHNARAEGSPATERATQGAPEAIFGGGCFWCMEEALEKIPGVTSVISGYSGGAQKNPTYEQVSSGGTGHVEVVRVTFDPAKVTYAQLLDAFWHNVDPVDGSGQFCDRGDQYRPVIFVRDEEQRAAAEKSKQALAGRFPQGVATRIETAAAFYPAETYHQDYYKKNAVQYRFYKFSCGRAARLEKVWGPKN